MPKQTLPNPGGENRALNLKPLPDIHAMREALANKIIRLLGEATLKECARSTCRRRHRCSPPRGQTCQSADKQRPESTPEQQARTMAYLSRELKRRLAQADPADLAGGEDRVSAPRDTTPSGLPSRRRGERS